MIPIIFINIFIYSMPAGGGPTGVETAAELHDMFAEDLLPRYFPHLKV